MATTTTNYGWDIPQSTDLVKDGATAIAALGQDIDTSVYTALGGNKSGLVLLNTTSFSGVTTQSINDVFSATYDNYRIITTLNLSGAATISFRFRVSGSDNTASNYNRQRLTVDSSTVTAALQSSQTSFSGVTSTTGANKSAMVIDCLSPFLTENSGLFINDSENFTTGHSFQVLSCNFNATTSFTGFSLISSVVSSMSGVISVYGYNK